MLFQDGVLSFMPGFGGSASLDMPDFGVGVRKSGVSMVRWLELLTQRMVRPLLAGMGIDWGAELKTWGAG